MMRRRQRGVALISIMLIVVMATVLAVQMTNDQRLEIQRSANRFDAAQARQYALGGEELARQILRQDFEERPDVDLPGDAWTSPDLQFEFGDGAVELIITDLQGLLNVNQLYSVPRGSNQPEDELPDPNGVGGDADAVITVQRLTRLVAALGIDPVFAARIVDWVDPDDGKGQMGAEDFDYLGLDPPYRTADGPMVDTSELRLLFEMEPAVFEALSPFVAALPDTSTTLNINTAPPAVLASLTDSLSLEAAEALAANRDETGGYETVTQFLVDPALAGSGLAADGLGVQSSFFRVSVRARFLDRFAYLTSIIQRNVTDGSMRVVYRDMSKRIVPVVAVGAESEISADG